MSRDVARMIAALVITVIIVSATIGGTIALTGILSPAPVELPTVAPPLTLTPGQVAAVSTHTSTASATETPRPTSTATSPATSTHTPTPTTTPTFTPAPPDPCADPAAFRAAVLTEQPRLVPPPGTFASDGEQILVATWTIENRGTCPWHAVRFVFDRVSQTPAPSALPQLRQPSEAAEMSVSPRKQAQVVLLVTAQEVAGRALDWRWTMQVAGPRGNWFSLPEKLRLQTSQPWVTLEAVPIAQATPAMTPTLAMGPTTPPAIPAEAVEPTAVAMRPSPTPTSVSPASVATPTAASRSAVLPTAGTPPQPVTPAVTVTRLSSPVAVVGTQVLPTVTTMPTTRPAPPPPPTATPLPPPAPPRLVRPRPPDNLQDFVGEETFIGYDATIEFQWEQDGRPLQPDEHYVIAITHKRGVEYRWAGQTAYYRPPPTQEGFMGWLVDFTDPIGRLWWKILIVKTRRTDLAGPPGPDDVILAESAPGTFRWVKPGGPEREKGPRGGID